MDSRFLGESVAREIVKKNLSPSSPKSKLVLSLAQDIAGSDQEFIRILRSACSEPLFESFLRSSSQGEILLMRQEIVNQATPIYSSQMLAAFESFLGGYADFYIANSPYVVPSRSAHPSSLESEKQFSDSPPSTPAAVRDAGISSVLSPGAVSAPVDNQTSQGKGLNPFVQSRSSMLVVAGTALVAALALGSGVTYVLTNKGAQQPSVQADPIAASSALDSYDEIISLGRIRVGAQAESPPMNYVENGKRTGLDFEIVGLIARQQEIGLSRPGSVEGDVNVDDYSDIPSLLRLADNRGKYKIDVVAGGLTLKDGDVDGVRFTIPYLDGFGYSLLVPRGSRIKTINQLSGKRVGIIDGDPDVEAYVTRTIKGATVVKVSDASETWQQDNFTAGNVDAIVYDFPFASVELKGAPIDIAVSRLPGSNLEYRFGVRSEDRKLLGKLNDAIRRIKDRPEYVALLRKYLPVDNVVVPSKAGKKTYNVRPGDTLTSIAATHLGSADRWMSLQDLNNLPNPNFIEPGQELIISNELQ